jgi:regulator of replication initiation timing
VKENPKSANKIEQVSSVAKIDDSVLLQMQKNYSDSIEQRLNEIVDLRAKLSNLQNENTKLKVEISNSQKAPLQFASQTQQSS